MPNFVPMVKKDYKLMLQLSNILPLSRALQFWIGFFRHTYYITLLRPSDTKTGANFDSSGMIYIPFCTCPLGDALCQILHVWALMFHNRRLSYIFPYACT